MDEGSRERALPLQGDSGVWQVNVCCHFAPLQHAKKHRRVQRAVGGVARVLRQVLCEAAQFGPRGVEVGVGYRTHAGFDGKHARAAALHAHELRAVTDQQVKGVVVGAAVSQR